MILFFLLLSSIVYAQQVQYNEGGFYTEEIRNDSAVIIREPYGFNRLYKNEEPLQVRQQINTHSPSFLIHAALGAHYIHSPSKNYTDGGIETNLISKSYTHAIAPIGAEVMLPISNRFHFFLGGSYYFNPFSNSSDLASTGVQVFNAKTKYLLYGKASYSFTDIFSLYIIGGMSGMEISVYNDITNALIATSQVSVPSMGFGFSWHTSKNVSMFIDGIYSPIGVIETGYKGTDSRIIAISQRKYNSFQGRIGLMLNFSNLIKTR
jgi:hypothetical protein